MAVVELAALTAPVSEAEPSGPDLDLAGDLEYMNFLARAEGLLPASYFSPQDGKPFDRTSIDFNAEFGTFKPFLAQTRDLRLLVLFSKFLILNRDLESFEICIGAIAALLEAQWDEVHPRSEGGDLTARMAALETLDDSPTIIMPLQFVPLVSSRRAGVITYRSYMIASGEAQPREGEESPPDLATVSAALMEGELPLLVNILQSLDRLQAVLARIRSIWLDRAGFEQAVRLDKTPQLVGRILTFVNGIVAQRDPSAAVVQELSAEEEVQQDGGPSAAAGSIKSPADAAAALAAVAAYFGRREPSNPALLLVRQAEQLIGKSFVEVMQILVPNHVGQANILVGKDRFFELPLERLSVFSTSDGETFINGGAADSERTADSEGVSGSEGAAGSEGGGQAASAAASPSFGVKSRQQAFNLLDQVTSFYRSSEPTSPVSLITDRARRLADRDFFDLLKDLLPPEALRAINVANE